MGHKMSDIDTADRWVSGGNFLTICFLRFFHLVQQFCKMSVSVTLWVLPLFRNSRPLYLYPFIKHIQITIMCLSLTPLAMPMLQMVQKLWCKIEGCFIFLANASNSIIGMWALKPSILELLAVKLLPCDNALPLFSPLLQYSVLYLLYSHCSR